MLDMAEKIIWLAGCLLVYGVFLLVCGFRGARAGKLAGSYFLVEGGLSAWAGAGALTAAALGGWVFLAHPGLIYREGLPAAGLSSVAIALPFCVLLLFGRLSAIGAKHGKVSIANLLGEYYQTVQVRNVVILVGAGFALPLLALQFRAGGVLLNLLSDDTLPANEAMVALALLVAVSVAWGGIRSAISAAVVQFALMTTGIILIGIVVLYYTGGFGPLGAGLGALAEIDSNRTSSEASHYLAVPGVMQWVASAREAVGSPWTGTLLATTLIAFTGLIVSPVFANWALCVRPASPLGPKMVWLSGALLGAVLLVFSLAQGLGGNLLGGNLVMTDERGDYVYNVMGANLGGMDLMETEGQENELVPVLIHLLGDTLPWLFGLLTVSALAALHAASAALLVSLSTLVSRAGYGATDDEFSARLQTACVTLALTAAALGLAWAHGAPGFDLTHLSLAIGAQMWPAILGLCWLPRLNGRAVAAGMVFGIITAFATEPFGVEAMNIQAWGGWPYTVHSAFWGLLVNGLVVVLVSAISTTPEGLAHRQSYHDHADAGSSDGFPKRAILLGVVWLMFAAGPGTGLGTAVFGNPADASSWLFPLPSLWIWHGLWWALGVALLYYLATALQPAAPKPQGDPAPEG